VSGRRSGSGGPHDVLLPREPGISFTQCRSPEAEATKLEQPGVRVVRSAREARALLAELHGAAERWRRLPRIADGAAAVPVVPQAGVDPSPGPLDPSPRLVPRPPEPAARARRPDAELEMEIAYLHALAELRGHWALTAAADHADHSEHNAQRLRRLEHGLLVVFVALVVLAVLTSGSLFVALAILAAIAAAAAWFVGRRLAIGAEAAHRQRRELAQSILASHDVRRPVHAADDWAGRLKQLGLSWYPPTEVEAAVTELRHRRRLARAAAGPVAPRPDRPATQAAAPLPAAVDPRPDTTEATPSGVDVVVAVDDDLYAGQRMALRTMAQRLAVHLPVLVLTTNVRLWQQSDAS
jgi:hypothetical protein